MKSAVFFIAGVGFIIRGLAGEYILSPYSAIGVVLIVVGVILTVRKPKPKMSEHNKILDDVQKNRPIKL